MDIAKMQRDIQALDSQKVEVNILKVKPRNLDALCIGNCRYDGEKMIFDVIVEEAPELMTITVNVEWDDIREMILEFDRQLQKDILPSGSKVVSKKPE